MPRLPALPALLALGACAAAVQHPTKSAAEQQVDIQACTDGANRTHPWEPFVALNAAYACLERLGYQRGRGEAGLDARVQRSVAADRVTKGQPRLACEVPCKPPRKR